MGRILNIIKRIGILLKMSSLISGFTFYTHSGLSNGHPQCLENTSPPELQVLVHVRSPFFNDWIMHSLKSHPHSTANRLSGPVPAHTASVLLLAGPPEAFQRDYFSWRLLRMETLCSRDKLLEPADAAPCAPPVSCRQAVDLYFHVKDSQNIGVSKWPLSVRAGWEGDGKNNTYHVKASSLQGRRSD